MRSNNRRLMGLCAWLGCALVIGACTRVGDDDDDLSGSGGSPALLPAATGGAPAAAPSATGGAPAVDTTGSGGGVAIGTSTGGAPASGTGGVAAGSGGAVAVDPDAGMLPPTKVDLGVGDGSDVVTIGDSWMQIFTNGGGIEGALDRAMTDYRHHGVPGTLLGGTIPGQFDDAVRDSADIKTVIMTGGGNDIMASNGCATKERCEESVKEITAMLDALWTKMADAGVKHVFYINYSRNVGSAPSDTRPTTPPDPPTICLSGRISCNSLATTDLVAATDSLDGIHPTSAACDRIATALLALMESVGARR